MDGDARPLAVCCGSAAVTKFTSPGSSAELKKTSDLNGLLGEAAAFFKR
jgi:hypothetical protein